MPVRSGRRRSILIGGATFGAVTLGGVVSIVGMFGPWVRTGQASRSSFELADLIVRLGFARSGPVGLAIRTWPMAPLSVVIAVVATWWIGGRLAAAITIAVGLVVGLVGAAVWRAPDSLLLASRWGALVTAIGAALMVGGGVLTVATIGAIDRAAGAGEPAASAVPEPAPLEDLT